MKTMKVALLATAALAAVSVSARADDTAAIKAQLEALTARIAQLEAAPAVPTGFSLLTVSEATQTVVPGLEVLNKDRAGSGDKATVIGILPTADAPASTTIEWSGYVRAAIVYVDYGDRDWSSTSASGETDFDDDIDVYARGQLKVVGKTDTAVGEVGVQMRLRADFDGKPGGTWSGVYTGPSDNDVYMKEAWGWWAMTPELTLGGGYTGSLGNIGYGYDGACNCYYTDNADVGFDPGDTSQMRLSYASGPMSAAIALEDASGSGPYWGAWDSLGVAAEIKYSGDSFNGEISGIWKDNGGASWNDPSYRIGAGVGFSLGDMASISIGAQMGSDENDVDFWGASILASMNLSDTSHIEVAYGHKDYDSGAVSDTDAVLAGLYYDPVDQLTIGLEGEWIRHSSFATTTYAYGSRDTFQIGVVTVFRF
jgi:hypothetical protein